MGVLLWGGGLYDGGIGVSYFLFLISYFLFLISYFYMDIVVIGAITGECWCYYCRMLVLLL